MMIFTGYREPTPAEDAKRAVRWAYGPEYIRYWNPAFEPRPGDMVAEYRAIAPAQLNDGPFRDRYEEECRRLNI